MELNGHHVRDKHRLLPVEHTMGLPVFKTRCVGMAFPAPLIGSKLLKAVFLNFLSLTLPSVLWWFSFSAGIALVHPACCRVQRTVYSGSSPELALAGE